MGIGHDHARSSRHDGSRELIQPELATFKVHVAVNEGRSQVRAIDVDGVARGASRPYPDDPASMYRDGRGFNVTREYVYDATTNEAQVCFVLSQRGFNLVLQRIQNDPGGLNGSATRRKYRDMIPYGIVLAERGHAASPGGGPLEPVREVDYRLRTGRWRGAVTSTTATTGQGRRPGPAPLQTAGLTGPTKPSAARWAPTR